MDTPLTFLARNWWVVLARGVVAILFGLAAFAWPGLTVAALILMLGAFVLADGIIGTIDAIRYRNEMENWWFWLLDGIVGIIAGALMLFMPGITAVLLLGFVAAWAVLGGILRIVAAIQLRKKIEGEWFMIASGALSIVFGVALIAVPNAGLMSIAWLIGFWAIAFGVLFVLLSFRLRTAGQ